MGVSGFELGEEGEGGLDLGIAHGSLVVPLLALHTTPLARTGVPVRPAPARAFNRLPLTTFLLPIPSPSTTVHRPVPNAADELLWATNGARSCDLPPSQKLQEGGRKEARTSDGVIAHGDAAAELMEVVGYAVGFAVVERVIAVHEGLVVLCPVHLALAPVFRREEGPLLCTPPFHTTKGSREGEGERGCV